MKGFPDPISTKTVVYVKDWRVLKDVRWCVKAIVPITYSAKLARGLLPNLEGLHIR